MDKGSACFDFYIQFYTNAKETPIEDYRTEWKVKDSPFLKVGRVTFPKQTFDTEKQNTFCENLSFNPWRALTTHRPLGSLNRVRHSLYQAISGYRHSKNHAASEEPTDTEVK